jgi:hypothetical protein
MRRLRILRPLRERDFALFQAGSTVSLIGDGLFLVAIAWQVYDIWNVPTAFAIVGVAETVPLVALLLFSAMRATSGSCSQPEASARCSARSSSGRSACPAGT